MKKEEYVAGAVSEFVAWMSERLDDRTFSHAYVRRRTRMRWECSSLFGAYQTYDWEHREIKAFSLPVGRTFASNARVLETLQRELRAALDARDNDRLCEAAKAVMVWGGVVRGKDSWLDEHSDQLSAIIGETRDAINTGDTLHPLLTAQALRFTSGMSKVYSLVCDDFVIYDSRVAATVGLAVVKFCQASGLCAVPVGLSFPWAPAKSAPNAPNPPLRDPRDSTLKFPRLVPGTCYVQGNMQASWLLAARCSRRA